MAVVQVGKVGLDGEEFSADFDPSYVSSTNHFREKLLSSKTARQLHRRAVGVLALWG